MSKKNLKIIYWFFLIATIICFYIGLRYEGYKFNYTLGALGLWGISYFIHRQLKKMPEEDQGHENKD